METEEIISIAQEYMQTEQNKHLGVEFRVMAAVMYGMTKGHLICAEWITERELDRGKVPASPK